VREEVEKKERKRIKGTGRGSRGKERIVGRYIR